MMNRKRFFTTMSDPRLKSSFHEQQQQQQQLQQLQQQQQDLRMSNSSSSSSSTSSTDSMLQSLSPSTSSTSATTLPLTTSSSSAAAVTPPASGNISRMPIRSWSASATTILRQRGSSSCDSSPTNGTRPYWSKSESLPYYIPLSGATTTSSSTGRSCALNTSSNHSVGTATTASTSSGGGRWSPYAQYDESSCSPSKTTTTTASTHSSSIYHYWNCWSTFIISCTFLTIALFGMYTYQTNQILERTIVLQQNDIVEQQQHIHHLEIRVQKLRSQSHLLTEQLQSVQSLQQGSVIVNDNNNVEVAETQRKLFELEHSQQIMKRGIQASDKRIVQEKFGPGPYYYVEMRVQFDDDLTTTTVKKNEDTNKILIETAHIEDMPHSVHLFLEQVQHGIYNGTTFFRNANHIVQASAGSPLSSVATTTDMSLKNVLFPEYSAEKPHKQYTLGYPTSTTTAAAGSSTNNRSGPEFYINLHDNSEKHGPKELRQSRYYYDTEESSSSSSTLKSVTASVQKQAAEPCFAHIIDGFDVIQRIETLSQGDDRGMIHPVTIQRMRIISQDEYVQQHHQQEMEML